VFTIVLQGLAWLAFLIGTIILGTWLRSNPSKRTAEAACSILHALFWAGVVPAAGLGVFYPGLTRFDSELGLPPLPGQPLTRTIGVIATLIGVYLIIASNLALMRLGKGAGAFWLTQRLVAGDLYERVRNPMALGLYLGALGIGLLVGSTYMTLGALVVVIPVHLFYLIFFEEHELELRLGQPYVEYKQRVPFLLPKPRSKKPH
jgi:protein-S-isoprenylcysteine O-methyltransferase Ste14